MELIIIKGKSNVGKTTIATLLHNKISEIKGIDLMWMMYDLLKLPLEYAKQRFWRICEDGEYL